MSAGASERYLGMDYWGEHNDVDCQIMDYEIRALDQPLGWVAPGVFSTRCAVAFQVGRDA